MELVDEDLVIDLTENKSNILKERFPGVRGLSSQSVRRFCSKRSISSRESTEKVTEMEMEASSTVISAFTFDVYEGIHVDFTIILRFCHPFYNNPFSTIP